MIRPAVSQKCGETTKLPSHIILKSAVIDFLTEYFKISVQSD